MSKLRDKLQRLSAAVVTSSAHSPPSCEGLPEAGPATAAAESPREERLRALRAQMARIGERMERAAHKPALRQREHSDAELAPSRAADARALAYALQESQLPGVVWQGPHGPLRRVLTHFAEDHRHGAVSVGSALCAASGDIAVLALDASLSDVDLSRALYIDTETTGLAGGAGTLPFVIGMAWFDAGTLHVEQMLLERPGLEGPMLRRLSERIAEASAVVSFNGKSFDWPLLRTRFVLTRVPAPKLPPHLDLLHCARRVYKRRLGSVRLVHLEEAILGFTRIEDIAGELIPETYLGYLRGQVPAAALMAIVEHNRSDLVALAAMLGELARRFRDAGTSQDARDQLSFARVAARADEAQRALSFAQGAVDADLRGELAVEAHFLRGELCLRGDDVEGAERAFLCSIDAARARDEAARAHLALAKLYEHRCKRFEAALRHARASACLEGAEANARRIARLLRRLGRAAGALQVEA